MNRRSFLKTILVIAPTIFIPKIIIPKWKNVQLLSTVGSFDLFTMPIVRRVFPEILAKELVSVQPMSGPTGKLFYLDFVTTSKFNDTLMI